MYTTADHPLPKKTFEVLAAKRNPHCVSIYLPMHKKGKEQNEHLAQKSLKSCIREVQKNLAEYQMHEDEIKKYLKPINDLIDNIELWRHPSDGIAIFLDAEGLNYYSLPIPFTIKNYVDNRFYLKPLLPLYHEDGVYYLLELSEDYVKLYEASRFGLKDVHVEDFAPDQLEKVVGFDFRPRMLQFRSGQATHGAGSFHGYGEGKDDKKKELTSFFRAIDKGVKKILGDNKNPLLLACVDSSYFQYKKTNSYPHLYDKNIGGDPEFRDKNSLHQESWKLMKVYFEKTKKDKLKQFTDFYHTPKTSFELNDIIPAGVDGKIDTLFVQHNTDIFGAYDWENKHVILDEQKEIHNISLTNLVALQTFTQGGKVYVLEADEMPIKECAVIALFRY